VQDVDVWQRLDWPFEPVQQISGFEHRRIERFSVEADERPRPVQIFRNGIQHRLFVAVAHEKVLSHREPALVVEPSAADEERLRAGAAAQACGFEIEEDERHARRNSAADERRFVDRRLEPGRQIADRRATAARGRRHAPFDDETAVAPFAAEDRFGVGARSAPVDRLANARRGLTPV